MTDPVSLGSLAQQWRKEADELDAATGGQWVEPSVKRECADELDACRASLGAALSEFVTKFAGHHSYCRLGTEYLQQPQECTCGFNQILADLRTRIGP